MCNKRSLFAAAAVVITMVLLAFVPAPPASLCQASKTWAAAKLEAGQLPVTLDDLAQYQVVYRRAAFNVMRPEQRRAVWIEQLRRFAASRELSAAQAALVDDAIAFLGEPDTYVAPVNRARVDALNLNAAELFPDRNDRRVFMRLGPADRRVRPVVGLWFLSPMADVEANLAPCECNTWGSGPLGDCDAGVLNCGSFKINCASSSWGCGVLWLGSCDGVCLYGSRNG